MSNQPTAFRIKNESSNDSLNEHMGDQLSAAPNDSLSANPNASPNESSNASSNKSSSASPNESFESRQSTRSVETQNTSFNFEEPYFFLTASFNEHHVDNSYTDKKFNNDFHSAMSHLAKNELFCLILSQIETNKIIFRIIQPMYKYTH